MALISPAPILQFLSDAGDPLAGGKLYTYIAGTTTPQTTYTDQTGATAHTNPIILNARGEASVWLGTGSYKFLLKTSLDVTIWTIDNIAGSGSNISPTFSGTATFSGDVVVAGATTLGDTANDTVTITGTGVSIPNGLNFDSGTLYIDATNNRVGVGTATPTDTLDVNGTVVANGMTRATAGALTLSASDAAGTIAVKTAGTTRITVTAAGVANYGSYEIGYRSVPSIDSTGGTAAIIARGSAYATTGGITIPANIFAAGDAFSIYNNSASAVTVTQGTSLTLRQAGTTNTGNRTLAARGLCTIWFVSTTEAVLSGAGVT